MSGFEKDKYKFSLHTPLSIIREGDSEKRREEIMLLSDELYKYQILFKDLLSDAPSYSTRNKILNIAYFIIEEVEIYDQLREKYELPIGKLIKRTPINRGFLETWRDYIITYVTILANPNYSYIQECLKIEENVNILGASEIQEEKNLKKIKEFKGVIIAKKLKSYIILTQKGEFKKVKIKEPQEVGMEATGEVRKSIKDYKIQIALLSTLIVLMTGIIVLKYKSVDKTVIIETTSSLKLEVNYFNKIIKVYSPTAKGEDMLTSIGVVDKDIDEGIYRILNYASQNEMIPEDGVTVVITGKPIEYGTLHKSEKFINESGVHVRYNNSGNEHNFNPKQ